jgi:hypothetical protein
MRKMAIMTTRDVTISHKLSGIFESAEDATLSVS